MYKVALNSAINTLFKSVKQNGFWDDAEQRIVERLYFNKEWQWDYSPSNKMRYMVFCVSNLLLAKEIYNLNTIEFDDKIIASLKYINTNKKDLTSSDLTYGALLSIFLQKKSYKIEEIIVNDWVDVFEKALDLSLERNDNHDALILIAGKYFIEAHPGHILKQKLQTLTNKYLLSQNTEGYFETGDIRANYHQRNMYVIWGIIAAVSFYPEKKDEIKKCAHKTLSWVWEHRRDAKDDAFYWHPPFYWAKSKWGIKIPVLNNVHSKFLFECHQTFFVNAINFYQKEYNTDDFAEQKLKAIQWIFGDNRLKKDLTQLTGINLPVRIMHMDGQLFIKNQNFKGTYEIGSYILALSGL